MKYRVITSVIDEPVITDEVIAHLRLSESADESDWIQSHITAAREYCEGVTGKGFAPQTVEAYLDYFPSVNYIELPKSPLQSVTSIKYKDSAGVETTMTVTTDYLVDTESDVGRIVLPYGISWPSFTPYPFNPIKIRYVTGYSPAPEVLKQAMLLLIGHWYENREASIVGTISTETSFAVKALLSQYRVRWWD